MRLIALARLAVAVSKAGGIGFLAAGTDVGDLKGELHRAAKLLERSPNNGADPELMPLGVGFINWGLDLETALAALKEHLPAAVWFFAPKRDGDLRTWTNGIRKLSQGRTKIWIQVGTVKDALFAAQTCRPDVLVVQGADAGGHGLAKGAGIVSLLPEIADALHNEGQGHIALVAAGGIVEGRGAAASLTLGASGVVLGTRFLASEEANIARGYQNDVLSTSDGGISTVRTSVYDELRGTTGWPVAYNGRGIINRSFVDAQNGMPVYENKELYKKALKKGDAGWGEDGRLTAYAGTGIGLVKRIQSAQEIVEEVRQGVIKILSEPPKRSKL
ncbi:hypothetical protein ACLMJK_005831 [Lecanora helva]